MSTQAKICGLSTPESVTVAIENGASHIGLVFYPKSPRYVEIETASYLANFIPENVKCVGLFVNPDDNQLRQTIDKVKLDMIQLHGNENRKRVQEIKETFKLPIMKALPVASKTDLEVCENYADQVDFFLFDAKPDPSRSELPGGNGLTFDWTILKGFHAPKPYFLAGGLTSDNVATAIHKLHPYGVDVSSGVESSSGTKDGDKIASFLRCVKSA